MPSFPTLDTHTITYLLMKTKNANGPISFVVGWLDASFFLLQNKFEKNILFYSLFYATFISDEQYIQVLKGKKESVYI